MAGITGLGTTYNLPNYTGILYALTPAETPLFSAIGGLTSGGQTTSTEFEWEFYDLRNPGQNTATEGATAPAAQERARSNATNVVQIHQEKVSTSYSKAGAFGQKAGSNNVLPNPVGSELDWQVTQMMKQMVRDIEYSFINGTYQKPSDNTTARKTRGLLEAVTSNVTDKSGVSYTNASSATDTITVTHALAVGDKVVFTAVGAAALIVGRVYYVKSVSTTVSFKVAETPGGTAITVGTATGIDVHRPQTTALAVDDVSAALQGVYDNGGLTDQSTATLLVNSSQKLAISKAYASAYGKFVESSRTVGGVAVDSIVTDFGTLNVMIDRFVPQDAIVIASLEQLVPVFLEVPGKGHFFAEPLAKTGSSDDVQLYGEVGLAYGSEKAHGVVTGLAV